MLKKRDTTFIAQNITVAWLHLFSFPPLQNKSKKKRARERRMIE